MTKAPASPDPAALSIHVHQPYLAVLSQPSPPSISAPQPNPPAAFSFVVIPQTVVLVDAVATP